jgi:hypothetical protein
MTFKEFFKDHPDFTPVSFSQIEKWEQCHRKWSYYYIDKLESAKSWASEFSSALIHPALAKWYLTGGTRLAVNEWDELWENYINVVGQIPSSSKADTEIYTLRNAIQHIGIYVERYEPDFDMYDTVSSEEMFFKIVPDVDKFVYLSKPDVLLARKTDKKKVTLDFKHSKWDINAGLSPFDRQFLGQAWVTGAEFMMKTHMQTKYTVKNGFEHITNRSHEPVDDDQMTEFVTELQLKCDQIASAKRRNTFPKHAPKACNDFHKPCEYIDLCRVGSSRKSMMEFLPKRERMME